MSLPAPFQHLRAAVFDAYGTLFDVHSAVQRHAATVGAEAAALSETWRQKQLEYTWVLSLMGRYAPFRDLTERALDYALALHPGVDPALRGPLLDAYASLDAYPEVPATLDALRQAGLQTAILSNGDAAMLDEAVRAADLGGRLDAVISVDPAGIFKTSPGAYDLAPERLGIPAAEILFVSSNRWDVAGAAAYGFVPVWVNRAKRPDEYRDLAPARVVDRLDALLHP
ncbi:haloacid dehalogenase type II [Methylobacterium isbiliense]|jgi:2-haloacid dehalogenase|uniref:(S)-2-haloacid dehalogenase n=1 Tax=Methylobacterium isbiliense TaxID=315478 RepID=A0ABQ4SPZ1_9HYPH|nr:haloacid dehalogenase type II [Methylobacterium isbiliense]MDN3625026.1 haloacid dehalogenase type II [Methylobacterium isbiliense]GJE04564.1 (S)-2-haloacid dehalogenase 4A [Methylobacterium isbiliense]